jgi:hypothetical protein
MPDLVSMSVDGIKIWDTVGKTTKGVLYVESATRRFQLYTSWGDIPKSTQVKAFLHHKVCCCCFFLKSFKDVWPLNIWKTRKKMKVRGSDLMGIFLPLCFLHSLVVLLPLLWGSAANFDSAKKLLRFLTYAVM